MQSPAPHNQTDSAPATVRRPVQELRTLPSLAEGAESEVDACKGEAQANIEAVGEVKGLESVASGMPAYWQGLLASQVPAGAPGTPALQVLTVPAGHKPELSSSNDQLVAGTKRPVNVAIEVSRNKSVEAKSRAAVAAEAAKAAEAAEAPHF